MRLYILAILLVIIMLIAHLIGMTGLYNTIPSYDIFMHILGGIGLGLFLSAFVIRNLPNLRSARTKIIIAVFLIGLVWEIFEAMYNIAGAPVGTKAYFIDTMKDLFDDTIGAIFAVWLSLRNRIK